MSAPQKMIARCPWPGIEDAEYARYHDTEWGVPLIDDQKLFEKLVLEGFQAGLSWLTILKKRENFRTAFHHFDAVRIARYGDKDIARLMADKGIVRNRLKIEAAISNANALLILQKKTKFSDYLWSFAPTLPIINRFAAFQDMPAQTDISTALAKALKTHGFRFVGPTTVYAFMQSVGLVNDHLLSCPRHRPCAELQKMQARAQVHTISKKTKSRKRKQP